jgi:DNA-nicking Smr family endonuclease
MPKQKKHSARGANPFDLLDGRVDETLDLHGFSAVDARAHVESWLRAARRRSPGGLAHIITGKGRNSSGRPVLRPIVKALLVAGLPSVVRTWGPDDADGGYLVRLT